uniref:Uncharacterized protein n=1 Tax=Hyaloperonospora arabidopsidis (strain Emoy2) TaxID=559515 RepID=M4C4T6_HYAAE
MSQRNLGTIKTDRDCFAAQISDLMTQRDRLNLDVADRDADRGQLVKKMGELKVEHDQALRSKESLFTRMAGLVSSASPSALPAPAAPPRKYTPLRHKRSPPNSKSGKPKTKRVRRTRSSPGRSAYPYPFNSRSPSSDRSEGSDQVDSSAADTDDSLLAALSSSRYAARHGTASPSKKPSTTPNSPPISVDSPSPEHQLQGSPSRRSMVDLFGEPSSDSEGDLSLSGDSRSPCNSLLTPEEFSALPDTHIPRDRVPR